MEALRVVGGPEERREAEQLQSAFAGFHAAVHALKQLEPEVEALFESLTVSQDGLTDQGVKVEARFEPTLQAAYERWLAIRQQAARSAGRDDRDLPKFIVREPVDRRV